MDKQIKLERLPRFSTIGFAERLNLAKAMRHDLSGYLGGEVRAGYWCEKLADDWRAAFSVKYAIPCNSATSGLLAACMAAGIGPGDFVWTTAYSMSATAACAKVLGARIAFIDIETMRFSMNMSTFREPLPKAIIVTNLFGHPAYLAAMRSWCDSNNVIMIEDNAQAPFAIEGNKYAGTVGHMGVFSLNVHKHIQCGEGGVVVTDDNHFGDRICGAINHGELGSTDQIGLNLRMTEPVAAIACAQLAKAGPIIEGRRALAQEITAMFSGVPWIVTPIEDIGCKSVFYIWAALVEPKYRSRLVSSLVERGVPIKEGYSRPLHIVFKAGISLPVVERIEKEIITFEVCAYSPTASHLRKMKRIVTDTIGRVGDSI